MADVKHEHDVAVRIPGGNLDEQGPQQILPMKLRRLQL